MADVYLALAHSELALKISTHRQSVSPALGGLAKKELVEKRGGRAVALLRSRAHVSIHPLATIRQQNQCVFNSASGVETT